MTDDRARVRAELDALLTVPEAAVSQAADAVLAPDAVWDLSAPLDRVAGRDAVVERVVLPLRRAFTGAHRRDLLVIGGANRRDEGGQWVACVSHVAGIHRAPLWGAPPSNRFALLRVGEFHRLGPDGRIVLSRIILDLPDLALQARRPVFPPAPGSEVVWPGPASQDGLCPPSAGGGASLDVVERMLGGLHDYDPNTFESAEQTGKDGTWAADMTWWGPGGVGSNHRWEGFLADHRVAFLRAFPDRRGGNHYCRIGDGPFAAVSGWPSMTMTHRGPYLGEAATDRALTLRVMDFYRIAEGRIAENWVLLDYVDLWRQMGMDLMARAAD